VETIRTIAWMKQAARTARAENRILGFVPTMGALHEGHLSLVASARQNCSPVMASIFVNPKQFGPTEDFSKYPRPLDEDITKLADAGVESVFIPDPAEIYPPGFQTYVTVEGLSEKLEGRSRPGHFRGVSTVVLKLLEIVQPHFAYFGRKDAQQARILQQLAQDLSLDTEIVVCPIVREPDGLALSSRNGYLNIQERRGATVLHRALSAARDEISSGVRDSLHIQTLIHRVIQSEPLARIDYAEIVDAITFEPVVRISKSCYILLAVFFGKTRLLDNLLIEPTPSSSDEFVYSL